MNISLFTVRAGLNPAVGFGYAAQHIVKSLTSLGHICTYANPKADLQINFTQPSLYKLHKSQYQIGYTPWESTGMIDEWREKMNLCDEVWATSDWVAEVFKNNGVTKPIYVYNHGIEEAWVPKKRILKDGKPFKFLHIGEPAPRKGGQMVVDAFIKLFGNNPDYELTIKAHNSNTIRVYDKDGNLTLPHMLYKNIKLITEEYSIEKLIKLHYEHHCLIYPSWGEGFGFIPLQALASGMPVISTYQWAQYKKYIGPLSLKATLTGESLPKAVGDAHNGLMYKPNADHLEDLMIDVTSNYKAYFGYYYAQSTKIHEEYNWIELTRKAFKHLEEKFK